MAPGSTPRDSNLIDALDAMRRAPFSGTVWRVVRDGRDPCQGSASGGRWDDSTFDVLYTSITADGAIAEMHFHLLQGQPILPSKVKYRLFELRVATRDTITLSPIAVLAQLGMDTTKYGQLSYLERIQEYPRTQEIAEVAHFLDSDGIRVPNARWDCDNLVLFCDRLKPEAIEVIQDHGSVDWATWLKTEKPHRKR